MLPRPSLGDLLNHFSGKELSFALVRAGLRGDGSKIERLERLRRAAVRRQASAARVLEFFSSEAVRRVATRFRIRVPGKAQQIEDLAARLTVPFPPAPGEVAATMDSVRTYVDSLAGSHRTIRDESDAERFLASALSDHFAEVRTQAPVPGHFGHRIDIDIQGGQFGVEVKLASAVVESSSEAYRLLGQAFYYDRRRYAGRLLVVLVGPGELRAHPTVAEVMDLLGALGVAGTYLPV